MASMPPRTEGTYYVEFGLPALPWKQGERAMKDPIGMLDANWMDYALIAAGAMIAVVSLALGLGFVRLG